MNADQALMGFEKNITHLDGRNLHIVRKAVTQPGMPFSLHVTRFSKLSVGFVQVVKGEGMPSFGSKGSKGDLFIEYSVVLPVELTPDMRRSESQLNSINSSPCPWTECLFNYLSTFHYSFSIFPFGLGYSNLFLKILELAAAFEPSTSTRDEL